MASDAGPRGSVAQTAGAIPLIDLDRCRTADEDERRSIAAEIDAACRDVGFLILENHPVPAELIGQAFSTAASFFALPLEEKRRYLPRDARAPRGYQALASRNLAKTLGYDTPPDLREQFFIGPLDPEPGRFASFDGAERLYAPNVWPQRPAEYRTVFSEFYRSMEALGRELMRLFAVALGEPAHYFDDKIDHHFSTCPANLYPPLSGEPVEGQLRAGPHTDFGSLTILAFDDAPGGLQVCLADGAWIDAAPAPGQLVVNLGDMMARWTNDRWRSTLHRVVLPPRSERNRRRMTIGYFLHPNYDAEVRCIESCQGPGNPPRYPPIMAGEHMRQKLEARVDEP